jgi:regulator of chromosome condensation
MPPRRVSKRNVGTTADAAANDAPAEKNAATARVITETDFTAKASTKTAAAKPKPVPKKAPARAAAAPKKPAKAPKEGTRRSLRLHNKALALQNEPKEPEEPEEPPRKRSRAAPKPKAAIAPPAAKATATKPNAASKRRAPRRPVHEFPILTTRPTERLHIFAFGTGENSELGLGPRATEVKRPRLNALLDINKVGIVAIAYGGMHGLALSHDGKVYSWGVNDLGALGRITRADGEKMKSIDTNGADSSSTEEEEALLNEDESTPKPIEFPEGTKITRIAAADSASFFVTDTGFVYGCGTFRVSYINPSFQRSCTNFQTDQYWSTRIWWRD